MLKAVIFDMDGTLLDSEIIHYIVIHEILKRELGYDQSMEEYMKYCGIPDHLMWPMILESLDASHYGRMAEIYGVRDRIEEFSNLGIAPRKFTASCNLVRGYIDSAGEAKRMMDFALQIGCGELGFVSLMEKNAFCKEAFVDIDDLRIGDVEHVISVSRHASPMGCRCRNFLYASGNRTLSVYLRDAGNFDNSESVLLFDGQYLRQGFGSENIIC